MASLVVNPTTINVTDKNQNTITVNFTCDKTLTDVKLSTDNGGTYKDKISMTQTNATFNISEMSNDSYNCKLKGYYEESTIIPVTGIEVDNWNVKLEVGQTKQLNARIIPANATNQNVNWFSNNESIATVNSTGLIEAVKAGNAKITATTEDGNIPYDVHVNVSDNSSPQPPSETITGIKADPSSVTVKVNETADIRILFGDDVVNKTIEYMSGSGAVASVADNGDYTYRVTGVGQGKTTIRFRTSDGKHETVCSVTVTQSTSSGGSGNDESGNDDLMRPSDEYILGLVHPMGQNHEAVPSGNIKADWKYRSRWENQQRPISSAHDCSDLSWGRCSNPSETKLMQSLGCWASIYRVEGSPFAQNTGVEMKDIKVFGWDGSKWVQVQHLPIPNGNFYPESFGGDVNMNFPDSVKTTSNSKIIMLREKNKITAMDWDTSRPVQENCMYHPFSNIETFDTKYQYIFTCISMRKVKWDESGIDDRDTARFTSNCGGDWWRENGLAWHSSWQHNKGVGQPRMVEIPKEWKLFCMTTVPAGWKNGFPI